MHQGSQSSPTKQTLPFLWSRHLLPHRTRLLHAREIWEIYISLLSRKL